MATSTILDQGARADASEAGLRWVADSSPGIRRVRRGDSFAYVDRDGRDVDDAATLDRIARLVIPPAWSDVWISPEPNGHLQATGRDARGRKQYRYHERWRAVRDANKFERLIDFARALPRIRRRVRRDLGRRGLPREKVLAAVVQLLQATLIRVGNEEYARANRSFGLTTLRDRHVQVKGAEVRFLFRGKSGRERQVSIRDRRLARIVQRCDDLPGRQLFQYLDGDGRRHAIDSADINEYIRDISGGDFTAKDFRTWAGTVLAVRALREMEAVDTQTRAERNVVAAIDSVSACLGNTRAVSRRCYVHPAVVESYLDGCMLQVLRERADQELRSSPRLPAEEAAVLALLQQRLRREARRHRGAA